MAKKTFSEKLHDSRNMPVVQKVDNARTIKAYGGENMLIAPPIAYDEIMRRVPVGKLISSDGVRAYLAKQHGADFTCPLTAGIFINIAARASEERTENLTPYWRTLKKGGELNEKYPGGIDAQRLNLEAEGHSVVERGKRSFVQDYQQKLFTLT